MNHKHRTKEDTSESVPYRTKRRRRIINNLKCSPYAKVLRITITAMIVVASLQFLINLISLPLGQYMENYMVTNFANELDEGE